MLDLVEELTRIVSALDDESIDYALCGGLALAVYGFPRSTVDIDMLIQPEDVHQAVDGGVGAQSQSQDN